MPAKTKVTSAEDIRKLMAARDGKVTEVVAAAQEETNKLRAELTALIETKAQRGVATAGEMRSVIYGLYEKYKINPPEEMLKMYLETDADGRPRLGAPLRIQILAELMAYTLPKLKSVEVSGEVKHSVTVKVVRFGSEKVIDAQEVEIMNSVRTQ